MINTTQNIVKKDIPILRRNKILNCRFNSDIYQISINEEQTRIFYDNLTHKELRIFVNDLIKIKRQELMPKLLKQEKINLSKDNKRLNGRSINKAWKEEKEIIILLALLDIKEYVYNSKEYLLEFTKVRENIYKKYSNTLYSNLYVADHYK